MRLWILSLASLTSATCNIGECDDLTLQFLNEPTTASQTVAKSCLQKAGENCRYQLVQVAPSLALYDFTRHRCTERLDLAMDVLQSCTPFYYQVSFNQSLADSIALALNRLGTLLAMFLNSYTCLPFIDLTTLAVSTDKVFFKFFRDYRPDPRMTTDKEEHFLYLLRSIEDLKGVRTKQDTEEDDPAELIQQHFEETVELDELRRQRFAELSEDEIQRQLLFEAFNVTIPSDVHLSCAAK